MRHRLSAATVAVASILALALSARADVKLPAILSDNMCLQANKPLPIWGTAAPNEQVTVTLGDQTQSTAGDATGKWMVKLPAQPAGGPLEMTVKAANTLTIKNIVVGEVWVASGQSNMEFGFRGTHNAATEAPKAKYPKIRLFNLQKKIALEPQADCVGKWEECTPESVMNTSAVGYFFARDIHEKLNVPVGLIHTSWGGTPAEAWTALDDLQAAPELKPFADRVINLPAEREKYATARPKWEEDHRTWDAEVGKAYKAEMNDWRAAVQVAKAEGKVAPPQPKPAKPEPRMPAAPDQNPNMPTVLYNGMIAPIINYAIAGAIWYQGESNAGNPKLYRTLFPAMITDWRKHWNQTNPAEGDFPFLFVQLANFMARQPQPVQDDGGWPGLREAQHMTLALHNTGEAVIIDVGQADDIHPRDKMDVGHRLALAGLKVAYHQDVVFTGPTYQSMTVEGEKIRIKFANDGGGLITAASPYTPPTDTASATDHLTGFAIAGPDKKFVWANARIDGDSVLVWSDSVKEPAAVRYAWGNNPECNLYNKEGLPASPFRSDDWSAPAKAK